jgi:type II secretory pathway predicted ATPase ExeA
MYHDFFGFRDKPFGKTPNPAYLYESPQHREALARLEYAVEEKELAVLTGEVGSGKTTLSRALIDRIAEDRTVVLIINPRLSPSQLLRTIATGLGLTPKHFRNDLLDQIHSRLFELYEEKREPVVIIDEAQLIPTRATFDEIRLLTNFQLDDENLLSVILIGQPELEKRLGHRSLAALSQRVGIRYSLTPLDRVETQRYIDHRIRKAGGERNPFTETAVLRIHELTGGVPRLINTVCNTALLDAFGEEVAQVDEQRVDGAAAEHRLLMRTAS